MFNRKHCPKCNKKVSDGFSFCPSCGIPLKKNMNKEDYGMLGPKEEQDLFEQEIPNIFGGLGGKMMSKMLNNAIKMMEKEMQKNAEMQRKMPSQKNQNTVNNPNVKTNFELYINGQRISPDKIKITHQPPASQRPIQKNSLIKKSPSKASPKNMLLSPESKLAFSKLEKKEPKTSVRRFSNKIIYEIELPGVNSIENVSIVQLENSIEIKALSKNIAYEKILPINFPISKYGLSEGKLILELKEI